MTTESAKAYFRLIVRCWKSQDGLDDYDVVRHEVFSTTCKTPYWDSDRLDDQSFIEDLLLDEFNMQLDMLDEYMPDDHEEFMIELVGEVQAETERDYFGEYDVHVKFFIHNHHCTTNPKTLMESKS